MHFLIILVPGDACSFAYNVHLPVMFDEFIDFNVFVFVCDVGSQQHIASPPLFFRLLGQIRYLQVVGVFPISVPSFSPLGERKLVIFGDAGVIEVRLLHLHTGVPICQQP